MTFVERLQQGACQSGHILCLGLDPVPERVALAMGSDDVKAAEEYLENILAALQQNGLLPSTLKPNLAYFEQYGPPGLAMFERLLGRWSKECLIIADAKRGDIGRSSLAYARTFFEYYKVDAITASPWMGKDSLEPFLQYGPDRGTYALVRTSNPGHQDLQANLWEKLAGQLGSWGDQSLGAVVGATSISDLERALELMGPRPLLIPGVGTQGGSAADVMACLKAAGQLSLHRVNVSSGILYAQAGPGYVDGAVRATEGFARSLGLG
jgi:orotidine-5'-phosphate decarboxylase